MSAITGAIGGIAGAFSQQGDKERAEQGYDDALKSAQGYDTHVAGQAGTEFDKMDPTSRDALMRALAEFQSKADQGGLDAKARANLEAGDAAAKQEAATTANQVLQEAARRGRLQGPAAMIQAAVEKQHADERARASGLQSAALAEEARDNALKSAVGTAGALHGVDAERAKAQDEINQFNVRNSQQNVANDRAQADQKMRAQLGKAGVFEDRAGKDVKNFGDIGSGIGGVGDFAMGGGFGDIGSKIGGAFSGGGYDPSAAQKQADEAEEMGAGSWGMS